MVLLSIASDFSYAHHLKRLAQVGAEYMVNPEDDLKLVCPIATPFCTE